VPRYTSYPPVPEWQHGFTGEQYRQATALSNQGGAPLSLYFHIPFCQSLCLYCGCNTVISKEQNISTRYLEALTRELALVSAQLSPERVVEQMHWGGGTPTYLTPAQLAGLYQNIQQHFTIAPTAEISVEIDPRVTSAEHCRMLKELGFNRLSLGVQDFNPLTQRTINRIQSFEMVKEKVDYCRTLGFEKINIDLIYGLPHQSQQSFLPTIEKVIELSPERIALFSYAHVPWLKKQQQSFARFLPAAEEKFKIFMQAAEALCRAGYRYIGLDHFAKPEDELCRAQDARLLTRNFQGYTAKTGCDLFGFGVSAISSWKNVYLQNWHNLKEYYQGIENNQLPIMRGCHLTVDDELRREIIQRILCHGRLIPWEIAREFQIDFFSYFEAEWQSLQELAADGLLVLEKSGFEVTPLGRIFLRNIAAAFDRHLSNSAGAPAKRFSQAL
jgi:oxygen-independent coproporphyrinogen III oxidase